jgi:signal transduction histidine kinase
MNYFIEKMIRACEVVERAQYLLASLVVDKGIEIENIFYDSSIMVMGDTDMINRVVYNLLDNAVKYSSPGGKITVTAEQWEMAIKIDISDTGKGIPEQHFAQIFKRFYREDDVHDIDGAGIGLYLCREIITKQGGYIQVKSEVGKGSTFSVFLPGKSFSEE